jgi:N-acetylmuramoyl-L-alanine amidase
MSSPEHDAIRSPRARRLLLGGLALALGGLLAVPASAAAAPDPARRATAGATRAAVAAARTHAITTPTVRPAVRKPRTLRTGMRGTDVKALQRKLAALRYDVGSTNGVFSYDTHHAVVAFQKHHRIARDGIVGRNTRAKLRRPNTPKPRSPRRGLYLEANLSKQVLFFYNGRRVTRIVDISSGNGRPYRVEGRRAIANTPRGRFRIQRKLNGWRKSKLGLLWRPSYFTGGYALHGSYSVPPYPASHGCVRMTISATNRLRSALRIGRPLYIYR